MIFLVRYDPHSGDHSALESHCSHPILGKYPWGVRVALVPAWPIVLKKCLHWVLSPTNSIYMGLLWQGLDGCSWWGQSLASLLFCGATGLVTSQIRKGNPFLVSVLRLWNHMRNRSLSGVYIFTVLCSQPYYLVSGRSYCSHRHLMPFHCRSCHPPPSFQSVFTSSGYFR